MPPCKLRPFKSCFDPRNRNLAGPCILSVYLSCPITPIPPAPQCGGGGPAPRGGERNTRTGDARTSLRRACSLSHFNNLSEHARYDGPPVAEHSAVARGAAAAARLRATPALRLRRPKERYPASDDSSNEDDDDEDYSVTSIAQHHRLPSGRPALCPPTPRCCPSGRPSQPSARHGARRGHTFTACPTRSFDTSASA